MSLGLRAVLLAFVLFGTTAVTCENGKTIAEQGNGFQLLEHSKILNSGDRRKVFGLWFALEFKEVTYFGVSRYAVVQHKQIAKRMAELIQGVDPEFTWEDTGDGPKFNVGRILGGGEFQAKAELLSKGPISIIGLHDACGFLKGRNAPNAFPRAIDPRIPTKLLSEDYFDLPMTFHFDELAHIHPALPFRESVRHHMSEVAGQAAALIELQFPDLSKAADSSIQERRELREKLLIEHKGVESARLLLAYLELLKSDIFFEKMGYLGTPSFTEAHKIQIQKFMESLLYLPPSGNQIATIHKRLLVLQARSREFEKWSERRGIEVFRFPGVSLNAG